MMLLSIKSNRVSGQLNVIRLRFWNARWVGGFDEKEEGRERDGRDRREEFGNDRAE